LVLGVEAGPGANCGSAAVGRRCPGL